MVLTNKGDCLHFEGDRPCKFYWIDRSVCWNCNNHYKKTKQRILLIKLDAVGDVIRTTPLAEGIKKKFPNSHLTWLVAKAGSEFLENNPYIDRILTFTSENTNPLLCEYFNILINLDKDKKATYLANKINAEEKKGFLLSPYGKPFPVNKGANYLYKIALDNWGEKTTNKKHFQEMIFEAAEIPYKNEEYFISLNKKDLEFAEGFVKRLEKNKPIIGINTGCGPKYPYKKWHEEGIVKVIKELKKQKKQVILFGGPDEINLNKRLIKKTKAIDAGCNNTLKQFAALLNLCDVIFTGDTTAIHIAIALKKPVVAVFGPTPAQEINLYKGKKLIGKVYCLNCYNQFPCIMEKNSEKTCMQTITPKEVLNAINEFL